MDKAKWKRTIKKQMERAGTYESHFDAAVDALSEILEQRDHAYQEYIDDGAQLLVKKTSDRGAENMVKNPILQVWNDLNSTALAYWRDLGLTPAGLKRVNDVVKKSVEESALSVALQKLTNGT